MADWDQKAEFMRRYNALHAEWAPGDDGDLMKLTLAPLPPAPKTAAAPADPPNGPKGIAARLMKQHEIQFAHSRVRPPLKLPGSAESDVPRAVSAKRDAARGRTPKVSKRAS